MEKLVVGLSFITAIAMAVLTFPDGAITALVVVIVAAFIGYFLRRQVDEPNQNFIVHVFLLALLTRTVFGLFVHIFELRDFFGGDAITFDFNGSRIVDYWVGNAAATDLSVVRATSMTGYGMNYFVAVIYLLFGRNILMAQSIAGLIGAATAPMTFLLARRIYQNTQVARTAAYLVALFPAFIIWSGQLLKDGLVVFLLVLSILMVIKLLEKFSYVAIVTLVLAVTGILTIRFYIFYMVVLAAVGSFVIGLSNSAQSIVRRTAVIVLMGVGLTYFGVVRTASIDLENFGDLERIERSRSDLSARADSGFGEDLDVSTTSGAIEAIPVGFIYLMFGPLPWQLGSFRAAIVFPEMLVWWASIPILVYGLWFTIKNKLRPALPALLFSLMLTIAYSIFQGNVGTAYRQRTQIQVFLFMFIAAGWTLIKENRENKEILSRKRPPFAIS